VCLRVHFTGRVQRPRWYSDDVCVLTVTDDAFSVQQELVKRRSSLLQKYIRHDVKFELEALYAVQLIVHRHGHPYGLDA